MSGQRTGLSTKRPGSNFGSHRDMYSNGCPCPSAVVYTLQWTYITFNVQSIGSCMVRCYGYCWSWMYDRKMKNLESDGALNTRSSRRVPVYCVKEDCNLRAAAHARAKNTGIPPNICVGLVLILVSGLCKTRVNAVTSKFIHVARVAVGARAPPGRRKKIGAN